MFKSFIEVKYKKTTTKNYYLKWLKHVILKAFFGLCFVLKNKILKTTMTFILLIVLVQNGMQALKNYFKRNINLEKKKNETHYKHNKTDL